SRTGERTDGDRDVAGPHEGRRCGAGRRASAEADHVGAAERVAGDRLEDRPRDTEAGPRQGRDPETRGAGRQKDPLLAAAALDSKDARKLTHRDAELADRERHETGQQCHGHERDRDDDGTRADDDGDPAAESEHAGVSHPRGARRRRRRHSPTLPRRTAAMRNGAPTKAVTAPTMSSPGRATTRPMTSEPITSTGPRTAQ